MLTSDEKLEQRLEEIRSLTDEWADAKSTYDYLYDYRKSLLSILAKQSKETSNAGQLTEARRHPEYLKLLEDLREANKRQEQLRWELRVVEIRFSAWQTRRADQRAERRAYGA